MSPDNASVPVARRRRWYRRAVLLLVATMALVAVGPQADIVPAGRAHLPVSWLWSWLAQPPAWSAPPAPDTPHQAGGTADGLAHYVGGSATRAGAGTGRAPGKGAGQLPVSAKHTQAAPPRSTTSPVGGHFDAATSKRVAAQANAREDLYQNADGSYTRRMFETPVNFKASDGSWQPIDTTISAGPDGRLRQRANSVAVDFAATADNPDVASVRLDSSRRFSYALAGAAPVPAKVAGSTVTYASVLPGTDLQLRAEVGGVDETLVLHSADVATSWTFPLDLQGLTARQEADGSVSLVGADGTVAGSIPNGYLTDSNVNPQSGETAKSHGVHYALTTVDGAQALIVTADATWLHDPARVFPVRLDPTFTPLATSGDTYAEPSNPGDNSTDGVLKVGTSDGGGQAKSYSFLKFDSFASTFSNQVVSAARLHLFDIWAWNCSSAHSFSVNPVTTAWTPSAVHAWPGPSFGAAIGTLSQQATSSTTCSNGSLNPNVGTAMTVSLGGATFDSWVRGGANNGLAITASQTDSTEWKIFDSRNSSNPPYLDVDYTTNVGPVVTSQYPGDNYSAPSLMPELMASASDPDNWPGTGFNYDFAVYTSNGTAFTSVADSGWIGSGDWKVPSGILAWNKTYFWSVLARDGGPSYSDLNSSFRAFTTTVPQPLITSSLSQNSGNGLSPSIANYTTSATDAQVATAGPPLALERDYNSRDPRYAEALGAGWSSVLDLQASEATDPNSGAVSTVAVTYPTGEQVAFGRNADGSFTPPQGRYATLVKGASGYTLTDKDGTAYAFTHQLSANIYTVASITNVSGLTEAFGYTGNQIMTITSASGRALHLGWTTPTGARAAHVATVTTDPATIGVPTSALTWTYSYTGDQLTSLCPPTSSTACSTYSYAAGSQYPTTVMDAGPHSYWRLGESSGTVAKSQVLANEGADNATYANVTLGGTGPLPGSAGTAAQFNGTSSAVRLPPALMSTATFQSVSLWFKTAVRGGVLFSYQLDPITNGTSPLSYVPALYIGSNDGKLMGEFWAAGGSVMASPAAVDDNQWHHVVLAGAGNTQTMYLDGVAANTLNAPIQVSPSSNEYVGAGFIGGSWPDQPHPGSGVAYATYFNGSISDVALYDRTVSPAAVSQIYASGHTGAQLLTGVTQPSGRSFAQISYDPVGGAVTQVTDDAGGVWHLGAPTASGSSQVYASAVNGSGPADYWRLGDTGGAAPANQVRGATATYSAVTQGVTGVFGPGDDTAVSFNGTSSSLQAPGSVLPGNGQLGAELWFNTTHSGVLLGTQAGAVGSTTCPCMPVLYVSGDGKLHGLAPSDTMTGPLVSSTGKCLDNSNLSTTNGNPIQIWDCSGNVAEQWSSYPDGTVRVQGKCLDNAFNTPTNGNKIQLWDCNGLPQQVWQVQANGQLLNPSTGKCLDVPNASSTNGTLLQLNTCSGTPAQWWTKGITSQTTVNDGAWHHAVITSDATSQSLYLDGALVLKAVTTGLTLTPQSTLTAGAGATGPGWSGLGVNTTSYFSGSIDELAVYRQPLTSADVATHYRAFKSSSGISPMSTVAVTDPGGKTITYNYDLLGGDRLISKIDGLGNKTSYGYDTAGFLNTVTDPNGAVTTTGHDIRGNVVSSTDCQNQATNTCSTAYYTYWPDDTNANPTLDPRNDKVVTSRDPRSSSATDNTYLTTTGYDIHGNVATVTTPPVPGYPSGRTTTSTSTDGTTVAATDTGFAPAGLVATSTSPGGAVQHNSYLHDGDLAQTTDQAGLVTRYTYDNLGRPLSSTVVTNATSGGTVGSYTKTTSTQTFIDADTAVALTGDDDHTQITLPFGFGFYGQTYTSAWLSTNGVLSFTDHGADDTPTTVPNAATPNTGIYPFWMDLQLDGSSAVLTKTLGTAPNRQFVIEWNNPYTYGNLSRRLDFEIVLTEATGDITVNYRNIDPAQPTEQGSLATVGVENSTGTAGTQYSAQSPVLADNTAITFHPVVSGQLTLTTSYTYDQLGRLYTVTSPAVTDRVTGAVHTARKTTTYDTDGNVTSTAVADLTGGDATRTSSATYNTHGRTATATDPAGNATTYGYDAYGHRTTIVDAGSNEVDAQYDANGHLLTSTLKHYTADPVNPSPAVDLVLSSRAYDPAGRLASVTDAMGRTTGYTYTDNGLPATTTRTASGAGPFVTESDSYDAAGHLTAQTTNGGATTTTSVIDAAGRVASRTVDPGGLARTTSYTYSADDGVLTTSLANPTAGTVSVVDATYDPLGRPTSRSVHSTGSTLLTTTWALDNRGLPTSMTDPDGNLTSYTYDEAGHLAVTTLPTVTTEIGGGTPLATRPVQLTGYDTFGETTGNSDPNGNTTTVGYDADGRQVSTTLPTYTPAGSSTPIVATATQHYNTIGEVDTSTDPLNHHTAYTYDQLGDVATVTAPDTGVTHTTYDTDREPLSVTDPTGAVSQATYDFLGRTKTATAIVRQPATVADTTTNTYRDDATGGGWLSSTATPAGATTSYTYDHAGELVTLTDAATHTSTMSYDPAGRVTGTGLADGTSETLGYDPAGRLTTTNDFDAAHTSLRTSSVTYDNNGQQLSSTDARGNTETFGYDAAGRLSSEIQPVAAGTSITTSFGYDQAGNRTRVTDGRGNPTITTYTSWNQPESVIEPSTPTYPNAVDRTFTSTYDADARPATSVEPGGITTTDTYDVAGNLTGQTGSGTVPATTARSFGYDLAGRVTSASAPGGTDTFGYDDRGLLRSAAGPSGRSSFVYNTDGLMTSRVDAAGTSSYSYDTADRLATVTDASTGTQLGYSYNTLNQPTKITYGTSADARNLGYDSLHRLATDTLNTATTATVAAISYGYDADDNLTSKTTTGFAGAAANTYTYDWANRLASWTAGTTTTNYAYDASGNRTQIGANTYTYNARNQLTAGAGTSYTYTPRGTLTSTTAGSTVTNSTSDAFDQTVTQGPETYAYDALQRLTSSTNSGGTRQFAYTGTDNTVASDGTSTYSRDPDGALTGIKTGSTGVLAYVDQHADVVADFSAASTTLAGSTTYSPLGTVTAATNPAGNLGYQSGWTDSSTGRVNMHARWYNPAAGQFDNRDSATLDPTPNAVTANRDAYANDNPLTNTDPTGHSVATATKSVTNYVAHNPGKVAFGASFIPVVGEVVDTAWAIKSIITYNPGHAYGDLTPQQYTDQLNQLSNEHAAANQAYVDSIYNDEKDLKNPKYRANQTPPGAPPKTVTPKSGRKGSGGNSGSKGNSSGTQPERPVHLPMPATWSNLFDHPGPLNTVTVPTADFDPQQVAEITDGHDPPTTTGSRADDDLQTDHNELAESCFSEGSPAVDGASGINIWTCGEGFPASVYAALNDGEIPVLTRSGEPDPQFGYPSWEGKGGMKVVLGSAGMDQDGNRMSWEHVVEQAQIDGYRSGFDSRIINHPDNIVRMRYDLNTTKGIYYARILSFTDNKQLRDWLAQTGKTWQQQYNFGMYVVRSLEAGLPLPE